MSNRKLIDPSIVTGIADAIRNKKGTTATIQVSHLADEIASIQTMAQSTKDLVNAVSGVTPTDEISLNNGIASGVVDAPSVQSWADTRSTADGGTIKDGIAYVKALRGKSIKVNQQIKGKDVTLLENAELLVKMTADGKVTIIIPTANTSVRYIHLPSYGVAPLTTSGHKYYVSIIGAENTKEVTLYNDSGGVACSTTTPYAVGTAKAENAMYLRIGKGENATATYTIYLQLADLTQSGMDAVTTADGYAQMMGYATAKDLPYMAYNPDGIVLNCKQKSVISKTKYKTINLGSLDWNASTNRFNQTTAGKLTDAVDGVNIICSRYTASTKAASRGQDKTICIANGGFIYVYDTAYSDAASFKAAMSGVMLTYESTEYTTLDTLTLPTLTAFPHGLCGVGTAYDEVRLAEGKATKRVGIVKLKDLSWGLYTSGDNWLFYGFVTNGRTGVGVGNPVGYLCAKYISDGTALNGGAAVLLADGSARWDASGSQILIVDKSYSGVASFKAQFTDDDILFYELSAETESTFTPCRAYYKASNNGQEVATAEEATAPFTAEIGYKEPTATELANVLNA